MKTLWLLIVCLFASKVIADEKPAEVIAARNEPVPQFAITIRLQTPFSGQQVIQTRVDRNGVFSAHQNTDKNGFIIVTGKVEPRTEEGYPLFLSMIEWVSQTDNSIGIFQPVLKLNEPRSIGVVQSVASTYTITLTEQPVEKEKSKAP